MLRIDFRVYYKVLKFFSRDRPVAASRIYLDIRAGFTGPARSTTHLARPVHDPARCLMGYAGTRSALSCAWALP
jgi:hypothetical protein